MNRFRLFVMLAVIIGLSVIGCDAPQNEDAWNKWLESYSPVENCGWLYYNDQEIYYYHVYAMEQYPLIFSVGFASEDSIAIRQEFGHKLGLFNICPKSGRSFINIRTDRHFRTNENNIARQECEKLIDRMCQAVPKLRRQKKP